MKYFFFIDKKNRRHIIVAKTIEDAAVIAETAELEKEDLYELQANTFDTAGFLISDK